MKSGRKTKKDFFSGSGWLACLFSALDKVTPKFIHQKIEKLLDEIAKYVDNGGQYLANTSATLEKASAQLQEKEAAFDRGYSAFISARNG